MKINYTGLLLYVIILVTYISVAIKAENFFNDEEISETIGIYNTLRFWFYTNWNLAAQIIFVAVAIIDEISLKLEKNGKFNKIRSYLFQTIVFPGTLFVMSLFWPLNLYDTKLVFPPELECIPWWINHTGHTVIAVPLFIEICCYSTNHVIELKTAFRGFTSLFIVYYSVYVLIYFCFNVWIYPIHSRMSWLQRILFIVGNYVLSLFYVIVGFYSQYFRYLPKGGKDIKIT